MTPVKIAVMGAGLIGKRHAEHVASEAGATLSAIVDPSDIGKTLADRLGARWYRSFRDMIADDRPEGVIIATPNQLHVANGLEAIEAGIPAIVEKPIADDLAGVRSLRRKFRAIRIRTTRVRIFSAPSWYASAFEPAPAARALVACWRRPVGPDCVHPPE